MIRINLLPVPKARKRQALIIQAVVSIAALVGVAVACSFVSMAKQSQIGVVEQDIQRKQVEIDDLKAKVGEVEKYKTQAAGLEQQLGVIRSLERNRSGPVKLLDELTEMVPRRLWISSFREASKNVTVEGMAESGPVIADFLDAVKAGKHFMNVQLTAVTAADQSGAKVHKFIITMQVKYDI